MIRIINTGRKNMKRRIIETLMLIILLTNVIPVNETSTNTNRTIYVDDDGGADYTNIQDAINAAENGDTVYIYNGSLSGYVTDPAMSPIEGASVQVSFHETYEENFSDSSGYYHITNIPICWCLKNATASRRGYTNELVLLTIGENTILDFVLTPLGNTLYVGGTGPVNYTTIQDAIDDASDGDTIYVYSGTYFEDVKINTSIVLQGEDKESTIIYGGGFGSGDAVVYVSANNVEITRFSIRNSCPYWPGAGIELKSNEQCIITDNILSDCFIGIRTFLASDSTIKMNTIFYNDIGIYVQGSKRNTITRNTMQDNQCGMYLNDANFNEITENNFINNERHSDFQGVFLNTIDNNYWERLFNIGPKPIFGLYTLIIPIPWLIFDWHPAKEPYIIFLQ
jgi:parallel beta-helix repeat protein